MSGDVAVSCAYCGTRLSCTRDMGFLVKRDGTHHLVLKKTQMALFERLAGTVVVQQQQDTPNSTSVKPSQYLNMMCGACGREVGKKYEDNHSSYFVFGKERVRCGDILLKASDKWIDHVDRGVFASLDRVGIMEFSNGYNNSGHNDVNGNKHRNNPSRNNNVDNRKGDIDKRKGDIDYRKGDIDNRKGDIDNRKGNMDHRKGDIDNRKGNMDHRKGDIDNRKGDIDNRKGNMDHRKGNVDHRYSNVDNRNSNVDYRNNNLDRQSSYDNSGGKRSYQYASAPQQQHPKKHAGSLVQHGSQSVENRSVESTVSVAVLQYWDQLPVLLGGGRGRPFEIADGSGRTLWLQCWKAACSGLTAAFSRRLSLLQVLASLPYSAKTCPPVELSVGVLSMVMQQLVDKAKLPRPDVDVLQAMSIMVSVVRDRLTGRVAEQVLQDPAAAASAIESFRAHFQDAIRVMMTRPEYDFSVLSEYSQRIKEVDALLGEVRSYSVEGGGPPGEGVLLFGSHERSDCDWRGWLHSPTVGWLLSAGPDSWHCIPEVPQYSSSEHYGEHLLRVWTLLTFYWGSSALWPKCRHQTVSSGGSDEKNYCAAPLLCSANHRHLSCTMRVRLHKTETFKVCGKPAAWSCHRPHHDAICDDCLRCQQHDMLGRAARSASTDVYNAVFDREVVRREGPVLMLSRLASRKPPAIAPNWFSSYRLQCSALVAIVKLDVFDEPLRRDNKIIWCEAVSIDPRGSLDEASARKQGRMAVRPLTRADCGVFRTEVDSSFDKGAPVAVIDLRVFVPEVISVLATFADTSFPKELECIPFIDRLIGAQASPPPLIQIELGCTISNAVHSAVFASELECLRVLSNDVKDSICSDILSLRPVKSLYGTQLQAFAAALSTSVHCTQGPPGTGKSFVGVCVVLSLSVIRSHANKNGQNLGPVLMLSYKNHALDEFLCDILDSAPSRLRQGQLIRCGKPESNKLDEFTERNSVGETKLTDELNRRIRTQRAARDIARLWVDLSRTLGTYSFSANTSFPPALVANMKPSLAAALQLHQRCMSVLNQRTRIQQLLPHEAFAALDAIIEESDLGFKDIDALTWKREVEHWLLSEGAPEKEQVLSWVEKWLVGKSPPPRCTFTRRLQDDEFRCMNHCRSRDGGSFCWELHCCRSTQPHSPFCANPRPDLRGVMFCDEHRCRFTSLLSQNPCVLECKAGTSFCPDHCCPVCLLTPSPSAVQPVDGSHACAAHQCSVLNCAKPQLVPFEFCVDHCCAKCITEGSVSPFSRCAATTPFCSMHKCSLDRCKNSSIGRGDGDSDRPHFCEKHKCMLCDECVDLTNNEAILAGLCTQHRCAHPFYFCPNVAATTNYCADHTCKVCTLEGRDAFGPVNELPPRHTCDMHPLCQQVLRDGSLCCDLAMTGEMHCQPHLLAQQRQSKFGDSIMRAVQYYLPDGQCCGVSVKKKRCLAKCKDPKQMHSCWYCDAHVKMFKEQVEELVGLQAANQSPVLENNEVQKDGEVQHHPEEAHSLGDLSDDGRSDVVDSDDLDFVDCDGDSPMVEGSDREEDDEEEDLVLVVSSASSSHSSKYSTVRCQAVSMLSGYQCAVVQIVHQSAADQCWHCPAHDGSSVRTVGGTDDEIRVPLSDAPDAELDSCVAATGSMLLQGSDEGTAPPSVVAEGGAKKHGVQQEKSKRERVEFYYDYEGGDCYDRDDGKGDVHPDELDCFDGYMHVPPSGIYNVKVGADFNSAAAVLPDAADGTGPQPMDVVEGASDEVVHADDDQDDEPLVNEEQIRLKEMYESDLESDDDDDDDDDDDTAAAAAPSALNLDNVRHGLSQWSWGMCAADRLSAAAAFLRSMSDLVVSLRSVADEYVAIARKEKSEASAAALKRAKVVGATVVGASRRLQALRAAEPFAVVVEEACEVMEATLVSVLAVRSLKKLELIGDHRQLPAFIQNCWFNLETIVPSIKTSLFERLVTGKVSTSRQHHRRHQRADSSSMGVPCTVLDEQRRMRSSISDLTRADYDDIVDILDHKKTATQLIGDHALHRCGKVDVKNSGDLLKHRALWHGKGRSVPGLQSCIFFWDLVGNKESRPEQGLSACNMNEAVTIAALTSYLLDCGVPSSAITIITPYKGQKNLLIKQLRKLRCLPPPVHRTNNNSSSSTQQQLDLRDAVTVSTVDRYQGDENDIVILSLVRARPGNRFVALLNRFIVAVSRARLGLYIVGSTNAVTGPHHWNRLLSSLNTVSATSSDEAYAGTRTGPQLPICCPRHPESVRGVSSADQFPSTTQAQWNSSFCSMACKHILSCSHRCALQCHSPTTTAHTELCLEVVPRPCELHVDVPLLCKDVEKKDNEPVASALTRFRCREIVKYSRPECSHVVSRFCFSVASEQLPPCEELVRDYFHPVCNHETASLKCHVRRQYEACPPLCKRQVHHIRPCGCAMPMHCHEAVKEANRPVQCSKSVTMSRPRCRHKLSLRCFESSSLTDFWHTQLGASIASHDNAAVEFGVDYGPPESEFLRSIPECSVRVPYRDACGHVSEVPCSKAFSYAVRKTPIPECKASVTHPCPICSTDIRIPCWAATLLQAWQPWDARASQSGVCYQGEDGCTVIVEQLLVVNAPPSVLDNRVVNVLQTACKQHITLERACGTIVQQHKERIPCSLVISRLFKLKALPVCASFVDRPLLCNHSARVRCNERDRLPPPVCRAAISTPFIHSCGRHQTLPQTCFDLQQLRDHSAAKDCLSPVDTAFYRCGHKVTVPCHLEEAVRCRMPGERMDPHDLFEDPSSDSVYGVLTVGVEYCEPDTTLPICEHPVVIQYACGHFSSCLACNKAFDQVLGYCSLDACTSSVVIKHPVCSHEFETQCWVCDEVGQQWDPWSDSGMSRDACLQRRVTDIDSAGDPVDRLCVREEDLQLVELIYPETVPSALLRCDELVHVARVCGHSQAMRCCEAFNRSLPLCNEKVIVVCPEIYCGKASELACHQLLQQPQQKCINVVERCCTTCNINMVSVECFRKNIECRRAVKATLPHCSHEVTWLCGKELDPRGGLEAETRSCKQCATPHWNDLVNYKPIDSEKDSFLSSAFAFVEGCIHAIGNVVEISMLTDHKVAVNNHMKARARVLRIALDHTINDSSCIWTSLPPCFGSAEDLQLSYHLLFAPVPPPPNNNNNNNKRPDWTIAFQTNRPTEYGHGVQLRLFNKRTLSELKPHEDGKLRVCVGLGYHRKMMAAANPFVNSNKKSKNPKEMNDRSTRANNAAGDYQKKKGFDCVAVKSIGGAGKEPQVDAQEVVHWIPGSVLPVCVASFSLHQKCCICFELYCRDEGFFCTTGHFVCWSSCFPGYLESASQPDAVQCVDKEGNLCCPECKESYDLYRVAHSGGPPNTFDLLLQLKMAVQTRREVAHELSEQEKRLRDEFRRIQEMTDLERRATLLKWSIVEDILTLKCPAPYCKKAFLDFEGCFALTCSACHIGFCAWCLKNCGGDAHAHVASCPENRNRNVYGTLVEFNAHHRQCRTGLITAKLTSETKEVQSIALRLLAQELTDLQIEIRL